MSPLIVLDWPIPDTLKALRAFLSKWGYYLRFIAYYATLAAPSIQYTQQEQHIQIPQLAKYPAAVKWFQELKQKLLDAPILACPSSTGSHTA